MPRETRIPQVFLQALITLIVIIILFINNNHIYTAKNLITHCKHPGMKQTINKMPKKWRDFLGNIYQLPSCGKYINALYTDRSKELNKINAVKTIRRFLDKEAQTANKVAGILKM